MSSPAVVLARDQVQSVVSRALEAIVTGNMQALESVLSSETEFWVRGEPENVPFGGSWNGRASVARFVELYAANVRQPVLRPRYFMFQEDAAGSALMAFVQEEGIAAPTGKSFVSESVHEWRFDPAAKIRRFAMWNNSFDLFQAFSSEFNSESLTFRHPLDEALITPTRACAADAGRAVELFYEYMLSEQWARVIDLFAPNVVSTLEGVERIVPFSGTYHGKEELQRQALTFDRTARNVYENLVPRYVVDGNRVCARFNEAGTYVYHTGCAVNFDNLHCFTVNDAGLIESFRSYNDTWRMWLTVLPEDQRPAGVSAELWRRHRPKSAVPPTGPQLAR
jgi:ketosteroid isomerase-like protein